MLEEFGISPQIEKELISNEVYIDSTKLPLAAGLVNYPSPPLSPIKPDNLFIYLQEMKRRGFALQDCCLTYKVGIRETTYKRSIDDPPPTIREFKHELAPDKFNLQLDFELAPL